MIGSRMIDGTTTKSAPKKYSCMFFFSLLSELQQTIQLLSPYTLFFLLLFKSLGAEPRISMCHNNHVYLFPTCICSIISYQLNLASTWCFSPMSLVRNSICSSLCDAWEIREGKKWKGEKGEITRAAVDRMRNWLKRSNDRQKCEGKTCCWDVERVKNKNTVVKQWGNGMAGKEKSNKTAWVRVRKPVENKPCRKGVLSLPQV